MVLNRPQGSDSFLPAILLTPCFLCSTVPLPYLQLTPSTFPYSLHGDRPHLIVHLPLKI